MTTDDIQERIESDTLAFSKKIGEFKITNLKDGDKICNFITLPLDHKIDLTLFLNDYNVGKMEGFDIIHYNEKIGDSLSISFEKAFRETGKLAVKLEKLNA